MSTVGLVLLAPAAVAQDVPDVDVVVISGPLDGRMISFISGAIEDSDGQLVVLQLNSPAVLDGDIEDLVALVANAPVPVAVWVGPDPAVAHGGAVDLLAAAPIRGAAPGVQIGYGDPVVAGGSLRQLVASVPDDLRTGRKEITSPIPGVVDDLSPSIGQFIASLDGRDVLTSNGVVTLATSETVVSDEGEDQIRPLAVVTFIEPGLVDRTLRLAIRPEAAFFFLVAGLSIVAFEFYAAGPGVAAAVGAICVLLSGYGMANLPMRWTAVGAVLIGLVLYTIDFQRNGLGVPSLLGTASLTWGGLAFVDGGEQISALWWAVLIIVAGTALWFGFALTTVVRSRFSTQTIGREHLIGQEGVADSEIAPDGVVRLGEARWRARSTRASGIAAGDSVRVVEVDGVLLEVEPVAE